MRIDTSTVMMLLATMKNEPPLTIPELAEKINRTQQEIQQILSELMLVGVPVDAHGISPVFINIDLFTDEHGQTRVQLVGADKFSGALPLRPAEGQVLRMALDEFSSRISESEVSAYDGLKLKLGASIGLEEATGSFVRDSHGKRIREWIATVRRAIDGHFKLRISYYSAERSEFSQDRMVRPDHLLEQLGHVYLRGYCETRAANRSFRLDRIKTMEVTKHKFDPATTPKAEQLPETVPGWDGIGPAQDRVKVRVRAAVADQLASETEARGGSVKWLTKQSLPDLPPSEWAAELTLPVYGPEWAVTWVLRHGPNAELLEPADLRTRLVARLDRMRAGMRT